MTLSRFVDGEPIFWKVDSKYRDLGFGTLLLEKRSFSPCRFMSLCCFTEPGKAVRLLTSFPVSKESLTPIIEAQLKQAFLVW